MSTRGRSNAKCLVSSSLSLQHSPSAERWTQFTNLRPSECHHEAIKTIQIVVTCFISLVHFNSIFNYFISMGDEFTCDVANTKWPLFCGIQYYYSHITTKITNAVCEINNMVGYFTIPSHSEVTKTHPHAILLKPSGKSKTWRSFSEANCKIMWCVCILWFYLEDQDAATVTSSSVESYQGRWWYNVSWLPSGGQTQRKLHKE